MDYGTGAIFGCPAHDQRDLDFANKYGLDVIKVVEQKDSKLIKGHSLEKAYDGDGMMINSVFLNGLKNTEAKEKAISKLVEMKIGKKKNYI